MGCAAQVHMAPARPCAPSPAPQLGRGTLCQPALPQRATRPPQARSTVCCHKTKGKAVVSRRPDTNRDAACPPQFAHTLQSVEPELALLTLCGLRCLHTHTAQRNSRMCKPQLVEVPCFAFNLAARWECAGQTNATVFEAFDCNWVGSFLYPMAMKPRQAARIHAMNKDEWADGLRLAQVGARAACLRSPAGDVTSGRVPSPSQGPAQGA